MAVFQAEFENWHFIQKPTHVSQPWPPPILVSFVSYPVSLEAIEQYSERKNLPISSNRRLLQDLESTMDIPLALVCVDEVDGGDQYYLCCFADCSGRPCDTEELLAIPVPRVFRQLHNLIPLEGDLHRLVAPRATISLGKIREDKRIGHV